MANVYVNTIGRNKIARNRLPYINTTQNIISGGGAATSAIKPLIIPFTATDFPNISDYSIYEYPYGQYPSIELYTYDENNNVISRAEKAIFNRAYDADTDSYKITDINFGALSDGNQTGYMKLMI